MLIAGGGSTASSTGNTPAERRRMAMSSVLVVNRDVRRRSALQRALGPHCAYVETARDAEEAGALRGRCHFQVVVLELRGAEDEALQWLAEVSADGANTPVILTTADPDARTAAAAVRAGAADLLVEPVTAAELRQAVERCIERGPTVAPAQRAPARPDARPISAHGVIGHSESIRGLWDVARQVAPTGCTVLIEGETGTGKELLARALHELSGRPGEFVPVNCGSITPDLLESELFGHRRGAFTGAHRTRTGLFSHGEGGTVFLDEIAEMPLPMQSKLLRVLQEKTVRPVGAEGEVPVDVRVLAASNKPLRERVQASEFREDLYYRLNVVNLMVPPLRERIEDLPELVAFFSESIAAELGVAPLAFGDAELRRLARYDWPGNIRELRNVIERALVLGRIPDDALMGEVSSPRRDGTGWPLDWSLRDVELAHCEHVLAHCEGNKSEAARRLGITRKTLERKLRAARDAVPPDADPRR